MDEKKRKLNKKDDGHIIDIGAALEEKERRERIEQRRAEKAAKPTLLKRILSMLLVLILTHSR